MLLPCAILTVSCVLRAAAVPTLREPDSDPFYAAPHNLSSLLPGQVVRNRTISTALLGASVNSYQVYYRTTDAQNHASGTVATIWAPVKPATPPKIITYQVAEDSLNIDCAPSWSFANKASPVERLTDTQSTILLNWALQEGYYVVSPDHEGPESALLVGLVEGRATLDGVRAAIDFLCLPPGNGTAVGITGYSGGGHASVWTSTLAEQYAPELNIVGAAFGGTPTDLRGVYSAYNATKEGSVAGSIFGGLANGRPEFNRTLSALLTPNGTDIFRRMRSKNYCVNARTEDYPYLDFRTLCKEDPFQNPVVSRTFDEESLLEGVSPFDIPVPKFPRFEWHGMKDEHVPFEDEAKYVQQQCARGADIRFLTYPGLNHVETYFTGMPGAYSFLKDAFEGKLEKVECGANITVPAIGSAEANELFGYSTNILLRGLLKWY